MFRDDLGLFQNCNLRFLHEFCPDMNLTLQGVRLFPSGDSCFVSQKFATNHKGRELKLGRQRRL